jgi:hypothetical protein
MNQFADLKNLKPKLEIGNWKMDIRHSLNEPMKRGQDQWRVTRKGKTPGRKDGDTGDPGPRVTHFPASVIGRSDPSDEEGNPARRCPPTIERAVTHFPISAIDRFKCGDKPNF